MTEPTSGTDTTALRTTARRDGDDYVVNGQKVWTSRAEYSDLCCCWLAPRRLINAPDRWPIGISGRYARGTGKSLTITPIRTMMDHSSTQIFFDDMRIPASSLIGDEGKGFRYILSGMNAERILIAAECIGDAKWFIEKASSYATERNVFGRPIGQNQGIQFPIARAYSQLRAAELMLVESNRLYEAGENREKRPILPNYSVPMPHGPRQRCAYKPMAGLALPKSMMSNANS